MSKSGIYFLFVCLLAATVVSLSPDTQAQTQQASCTFHTFSFPSSPQMIFVTGVNDYGTVVGEADFASSPHARAFIHYSGGSTIYWVPSGAKAADSAGAMMLA